MTPEELFATYQPPVQALCVSLRLLIRDVLPDLEEVVFAGIKNVSYGTGASHADADLICYIAPYTRSVNLGFYRGVVLPDPGRLLTGTGKRLRHIKFCSPDQVDSAGVHDLLRAALDERQDRQSTA